MRFLCFLMTYICECSDANRKQESVKMRMYLYAENRESCCIRFHGIRTWHLRILADMHMWWEHTYMLCEKKAYVSYTWRMKSLNGNALLEIHGKMHVWTHNYVKRYTLVVMNWINVLTDRQRTFYIFHCYSCACISASFYMYVQIHIRAHACSLVYIDEYTHTYTHKKVAYVDTHIHVHAYTYMCTHAFT